MKISLLRLFFTFSLLGLIGVVYGQEEVGGTDTTKILPFPYEVLEENPASFPANYVAGGLVMGTRPLHPSTFLTSFQGFYRYKQHGFIKATWDFPVLADYDFQLRHVDEKDYLETTDDFNVYNQFDLGIGIFFNDTTVKRYKTVKFRAVEDSLLNKVDPPAVYYMNFRRIWGARVGYFRYQGIVTNFFLNEAQLLADDGTFLANGGPRSIYNPEGAAMMHTNWSVNSFYIGVDFRQINHAVVRAKGKVRRNSRVLNAYADFMFAPITAINDMEVRDFETGEKTSYVVDHDNGGFQMRSWGFRLGGEAYWMITPKSGITVQTELGIRPGLNNVKNPDAVLGNRLFLQGRLMYVYGFQNR